MKALETFMNGIKHTILNKPKNEIKKLLSKNELPEF